MPRLPSAETDSLPGARCDSSISIDLFPFVDQGIDWPGWISAGTAALTLVVVATDKARSGRIIEALGVLASEKAITAEVVYKMWGGAILTAWPKWGEPVRRLREYDREPDTFLYFEQIALEIQRIADERRELRKEAGIT